MVKIHNNLNSKYTTELINLDYGDFFELNTIVYQVLYHNDTSRIVKDIETGEVKYMDRKTVVCRLDVTIIIDGYSEKE